MELTLPKIVIQVLRIFTILCLFLDFCTDCYFLSDSGSWKIRTGLKPNQRYDNLFFYINISVLAWLLLSIFLAVVEICMLFEVKVFEVFSNGIIKPVIIVIMGIAHLGICGDLGLACGILTLFAGAAWLVLSILLMI